MSRWPSARKLAAEKFDLRIVELDKTHEWKGVVHEALLDGTRIFIAAGGDGTVGTLVDALAHLRGDCGLDLLTLGAIGLGSSNDFHKVASPSRGTPCRIGPDRTARDVCVAKFETPDGRTMQRHFIVSGSVGFAAQANEFFSSGHRMQSWLRARWTGGAILFAAQHTFARYRNIDAVLRLSDGHPLGLPITNLSVSKTPWVSGGFRYDTPVAPDDGLLSVNLCTNMTRRQTANTLLDLSRGRFGQGAGRQHWQVPFLRMELKGPAALELDGEIFHAREVAFGILPQQIGIFS